jgi:predicted dehydrogenase
VPPLRRLTLLTHVHFVHFIHSVYSPLAPLAIFAQGRYNGRLGPNPCVRAMGPNFPGLCPRLRERPRRGLRRGNSFAPSKSVRAAGPQSQEVNYMSISRRQFLGRSAAVVVAGTMAAGKVWGANEKVRMGVIGFNGRGGSHIDAWIKHKDAELVALCDVDRNVLDRGVAKIKESTNRDVKAFTDLRQMLDDPEIDAVSIATPNHWHALASVWACEAGKDVYVEKPCSHNVWEGRQLVNAARKYNRVVQHGTQIRSNPAIIEAMQKIRDGVLGEVYMARGLCYKTRPSIGTGHPGEPPAALDWNLWQGPAQEKPFMIYDEGTGDDGAGRGGLGGLFVHYNWHYNGDYGNGDLGNQGVHQMDLARWALGVGLPKKVSGMGGLFIYDDAKDVPNVTTTAYYYPDAGKKGRMLVFEVRPSYTNDEGGAKIGDLIYGSEGYMVIDSYDHYQIFLGKDSKPAFENKEGGDHYGNFLAAVKARDPKMLNAEIEEGHLSSALCHLGMISVKTGRSFDFDPDTETIVGDEEANKMLTREYREGFAVPEIKV